MAHEANRQIGEILFTKQAISRRDQALQSCSPRKIARAGRRGRICVQGFQSSIFPLAIWKAIDGYREIRRNTGPIGRAGYEIGAAYYVGGAGTKGAGGRRRNRGGEIRAGIDAFDEFIEHPDGRWVPEANLELQLVWKNSINWMRAGPLSGGQKYPSPLVVDVRIARIKERQNQKRR